MQNKLQKVEIIHYISDPNAIKLGIFYYIQKYKQKYIKQKIKCKQKNFLYPEVSKYISKFLRKCQGVS